MRWRAAGTEQGWRRSGDGADRALLRPLTGAAVVGLLALAMVALTLQVRQTLLAAGEGGPCAAAALPIYAAAGVFLAIALAVVVLQGSRVSSRVAGPEQRLVRALQRMRTGDLAFRVHLRKGDLLGGLAQECNDLLDWLNANPPPGSRTGTDLYEVHPEETEFHDVVEAHE